MARLLKLLLVILLQLTTMPLEMADAKQQWKRSSRRLPSGFVRTSGTRFELNGHPFYVNGFNAYWMLMLACRQAAAGGDEESSKDVVSSFLHQAASLGLTVARTWAFNDGGSSSSCAIQTQPGVFNEQSLQALDFVVAQAGRNGVRLILSLCNNYDDFGGKSQYVRWAWEAGLVASAADADAFFTHPVVRSYFKHYVQEWIQDMAAFVKSLDSNHMLEVGMEGFYSASEKSSASRTSPGEWADNSGTAFPELWLEGWSSEEQLRFQWEWVREHAGDAETELRKPVLFAEFGRKAEAERAVFFSAMYSAVYDSAMAGGAASGALLWQLFPSAMPTAWNDGFQLRLDNNPSSGSGSGSGSGSIAAIISAQSRRLAALNSRS